jgi:hypothetical protein
LCWALFFWFYRGTTKGVLEIRRIAFPLPLVVFFILSTFYTFYSIDYAVSRDFFLQLVSYTAIFFLAAHVASRKEARWIVVAVVILSIITAFYGLYQYLWGFQGLIDKIEGAEVLPPSISFLVGDIIGRLEGGRVFATFLLPSHFAAFLGMGIPLSGAFILVHKDWMRYLVGLALALQIFVLYLTKSFSGWLSLILACGCFTCIYLGYIKRIRARYLVCLVGAFFLVLALIFGGLSLQRPDNPFASISNNPMVLRVLNWSTTIDMITDAPLIGRGLNTFGFIYPSYQMSGVNIVHHSHNTYLQLGVEMGIIGTIAFLWFACWWIWRTVRVLKESKDKNLRIWTGSLMVGGLAFFIHHAYDFEFYLPSVTLAGFAVLALAVGAQKGDTVYRITMKGRGKILYTALGFAAAMTASLLLLFPFYGQMHYLQAESLLNSGPEGTEAASAELQKAIRLDPHNSQYHHRYGALLSQGFSLHREGIAEVQEAIRLSPWRHYYHFDLGMIYLVSGEREKAVEEIKKASQLYPLHEDYHQWLKTIYLQMGEEELASQEERWIERKQRGEMD